jgi:hypothetical protein
MIHPPSLGRKRHAVDPFRAVDEQLQERIVALDAHPTLLHPPDAAWDRARRQHVGAPVIELSGACGVLAFYKAAGAIALRRYANPVLSIGASGGTVPVAFLQTGAPDDVVLSAMKGLPAPAFADYDRSLPQWQRAGSSSADAMTAWLDGWLTYLEHPTWQAFRFDDRQPGLEDWSHRLNVAVTYVAVPTSEYMRATENAPLNLVSFVRLLLRCTRKAHLSFHELIVPRDLQPGDHQQLPWLFERFDEERVANWMAHSMRHPGAFRPYAIPHDDGNVYLFLDGCLMRRLPTPFSNDELPPLPTVAFEMLDPLQAGDLRYLERLRVDSQNTLVSWGGFPGVNPLDFEKLTPRARVLLYASGSVRADEVYPTDLFDYLKRYEVLGFTQRSDGGTRSSESVASVLRRKLQRGLIDIRRHEDG